MSAYNDALPPITAPPRGNPPRPFDGRRDALGVTTFLQRMDTHMNRFVFRDDLDRINYFADFLESEANQWYHTLIKGRHLTFKEFLTEFQAKYYNITEMDDLLRQFLHCRQTKSLEAYNEEYLRIIAALSPEHCSPQLQRVRYVEGLKPPLNKLVTDFGPVSLADAMTLALTQEESGTVHPERPIKTLPYARDHYDPMDADSVQTKRTSGKLMKLSAQERNLLKKQGVCFRCRDGKHIASKCPRASFT